MADQPVVDYGPLAALIGTWKGDKGMDFSPEPKGTEENPYYETIVYEAAGDLDNADKQENSQKLSMLRYLQVVTRKSNDEVFHDETGYWMWDAERGIVMHSLAIPRAVCVLAGGSFSGTYKPGDDVIFDLKAGLDDPDWGIIQSPFMRDNAKTMAYTHRVEVNGNKLSYKEVSYLDIYGRKFEHVDQNTLTKVD